MNAWRSAQGLQGPGGVPRKPGKEREEGMGMYEGWFVGSFVGWLVGWLVGGPELFSRFFYWCQNRILKSPTTTNDHPTP